MAKMVGLSRTIKTHWLNKTVSFLKETSSEDELKEAINEYLRFEIESPTVLRKTREILMRIWFYDLNDDYILRMRQDAMQIMNKTPEHALVAHWGLMLLTYPVFGDLCRMIGKLSEFESAITTRQIKQKLFDEWGERSTILHSTDKMIATLKEIGVLESVKTGQYRVVKMDVSRSEEISYLLRVAMRADGSSYYSMRSLKEMSILFPFRYDSPRELFMNEDQFVLSTFNGETSVSLR